MSGEVMLLLDALQSGQGVLWGTVDDLQVKHLRQMALMPILSFR